MSSSTYTMTKRELEAREAAQEEARQLFDQTVDGRRALARRRWLNIFAGFVVVAGFMSLILGPIFSRLGWRYWVAALLVALFAAGVLSVIGHVSYENSLAGFSLKKEVEAQKELDAERERAFAASQLPALIAFNRDEMTRYHNISTTVARRAAFQSQVAMMIGFLTLIAGAITVVMVRDQTSKIVIAALTALGGLFSSYISKTFFEEEKRAVDQLYRYWRQPLSSSYLLFAERVAKDIANYGDAKGAVAAMEQLVKIAQNGLQIGVTSSAEPTSSTTIGGVNGATKARIRSQRARSSGGVNERAEEGAPA